MTDFQRSKKSIPGELADIDRKIIELLERRARLMDKVRRAVKGKSNAAGDADVEKRLWKVWQATAVRHSSDARAWRRLFDAVMEVPPMVRHDEAAPKAYVLSPKAEPVDVDLPAPGSTLEAKLWAVLSLRSDKPFRIDHVQTADTFVELVKSLNKCGASLSWEQGALIDRGEARPDFSGKVVHAGDDLLNFCLFAALALPYAGWIKVTGGPELKQADLRSIGAFLPRLGARLVTLIPRSHGLPARVENSGVVPEVISLPDGLPAEMAVALAAAAPTYARGLTMRWAGNDEVYRRLVPVADVLRSCGISVKLSEDSITVLPAPVTLPETASLSADSFLGGVMLALPRFTEGTVRLSGGGIPDHPDWKAVLSLLENSGLTAESSATECSSSLSSAVPESVIFDTAAFPEFTPLAASLAAVLSVRGTEASLRLSEMEDETVFCEGMLEAAGFELADADGEGVRRVTARQRDREAGAWVSPTARHTVAFALLSLVRPGLKLANPGSVSDVMPGFWNVLNGLPRPQDYLENKRKAKEEENARKPVRRRIRL